MSSFAQPSLVPARPAAPAYSGSYGAARPVARPAGHAPGAPGAPSAYAAQAARYRDAELASATPGQLVVMLFDKMLLTVRRARVAMEAGQIDERTEQILKAHDMLGELRLSLDFEQGGEIARQLDALYAFALRELLDANRLQSTPKLDTVLTIATDLREAFAGALVQLQGQAKAAAPLAARTA
jgi:flagellar protein FliS